MEKDRYVLPHECKKRKDSKGGWVEHMILCLLKKVEGFDKFFEGNEGRCRDSQLDGAYVQQLET